MYNDDDRGTPQPPGAGPVTPHAAGAGSADGTPPGGAPTGPGDPDPGEDTEPDAARTTRLSVGADPAGAGTMRPVDAPAGAAEAAAGAATARLPGDAGAGGSAAVPGAAPWEASDVTGAGAAATARLSGDTGADGAPGGAGVGGMAGSAPGPAAGWSAGAGGSGGPPGGPPGGPYPGAYPGGTAVPPTPHRRLRRSRRNRVAAGVAGGLAEYLDVDPVALRVLFGVLVLFGGIGILLYLIGWLVMPDEGEEVSPAESLVGRGRTRSTSSSLEAILLALAIGVLAVLLVRGNTGDLALLAVVLIGGVLLARVLEDRRRGGRPAGPGYGSPAATPAGTPPAYQTAGYPAGGPAAYQSPYAQPAGSSRSGYPPFVSYDPLAPTAATAEMPTAEMPTAATPGAAPTAVAGAATWYGVPAAAPYPPAPPAPKERSMLGGLTLSAVAVALGILGALDAAGQVHPSVRQYLALALAVLGTGMLVGAWRGRARWLVWLGVPLVIAVVVAGTAESTLRGGTGDRMISPLTAADIADRYELGAGTITLDLTSVNFVDHDVSTSVRVGVGTLDVHVPAGVDVTVRAHSGVGQVNLFDVQDSGSGVSRTLTDDGADGAGGGTLDLSLDVGLGQVAVDRA